MSSVDFTSIPRAPALLSGAHSCASEVLPCVAGRAEVKWIANSSNLRDAQVSTCSGTILVADDDVLIRDDIAEILKDEGREIIFSATAAETWRVITTQNLDLVLLDLKFPDLNDLSLLRKIKQQYSAVEVIIISSQSENIPQVVEAIKIGAFDFVPKPFEAVELRNRVEKALDRVAMCRSQQFLLKDLKEKSGVDSMIGDSPPMRKIMESLARLAPLDGSVLVQGESGTGKELAARALHFPGKRKFNPFVSINCAAIPDMLVESVLFGHKKGAFTGAHESVVGRLEAANDGTVFLDEIGDMPIPQQASLLRVLEYKKFIPVGETKERHCRARFVFATNRDLRDSVRTGTFREDLFYRINVATVSMPPLRTRTEDIPVLANYYCTRLSAEMGRKPISISKKALDLFCKYDWPGNVRELKNVIEAAVMMGDPSATSIVPEDLSADLLALGNDPQNLELTASDLREKRSLLQALRETCGNQTDAAKMLGWHRNTVRNRMKVFGIVTDMEKPT